MTKFWDVVKEIIWKRECKQTGARFATVTELRRFTSLVSNFLLFRAVEPSSRRNTELMAYNASDSKAMITAKRFGTIY
jgi:hypothetical protein